MIPVQANATAAYVEGGEVVIILQDIPDGAADGADHAVHHVHHPVGGHLVTVQDPGTVHSHNLDTHQRHGEAESDRGREIKVESQEEK